MKRVVITGATSFIGVHLICEWLKEECEIIAVVRPGSLNLPRLPENSQIHIVTLEMGDYDKLPLYIDKADYFYHLAWAGSRAPLRDDVSLQERNFKCSLLAMNSAVKMGCKMFMGVGSQAEYGSQGSTANENYPCNPTNEYGKQKLNTMLETRKIAQEAGMNFIWLRMFSVYGRYDYPKTMIATCLDKMSRNEQVDLTACEQLWDYLYVEDAAQAMVLFANKNVESGVYNIANGSVRPIKDYVIDMKEVTRSSSIINFGAIPYGEQGPVNLQPDTSKVQNMLGWHAQIPFKIGIAKSIGVI
ncbi:MAG: NAD(P)-dependent oxidoreductase [Saccharofermentans sp.]|nr:NAD(P)-dependent oxidoreductase [Saccharofermentans sp.]